MKFFCAQKTSARPRTRLRVMALRHQLPQSPRPPHLLLHRSRLPRSLLRRLHPLLPPLDLPFPLHPQRLRQARCWWLRRRHALLVLLLLCLLRFLLLPFLSLIDAIESSGKRETLHPQLFVHYFLCLHSVRTRYCLSILC